MQNNNDIEKITYVFKLENYTFSTTSFAEKNRLDANFEGINNCILKSNLLIVASPQYSNFKSQQT